MKVYRNFKFGEQIHLQIISTELLPLEVAAYCKDLALCTANVLQTPILVSPGDVLGIYIPPSSALSLRFRDVGSTDTYYYAVEECSENCIPCTGGACTLRPIDFQ